MLALFFFFLQEQLLVFSDGMKALGTLQKKQTQIIFRVIGLFTFVSSYFLSWKEAKSYHMMCVKTIQI